MKSIVFVFACFLLGCPTEDSPNCEKIMVCESDREMLCYEMDNGCVDECHYWVFETCYEVCKDDQV